MTSAEWFEPMALLGGLFALFLGFAAILEGAMFDAPIARRLWKIILGIVVAFVAMVVLSEAAYAHATPCAPREIVERNLDRDYGERRVLALPKEDGVVIELWVSDATGSWTILLSPPPGDLLCTQHSGDGFAIGTDPSGERISL